MQSGPSDQTSSGTLTLKTSDSARATYVRSQTPKTSGDIRVETGLAYNGERKRMEIIIGMRIINRIIKRMRIINRMIKRMIKIMIQRLK